MSAEQRTEVGGIPVWWEETPGTFHGALFFRVGVADERMVDRGLTHLVEHLAMPPGIRRPEIDANASVDAFRTSFWADGDPASVLEFLQGVLARLANLPIDRLDHERRVLLAEAETRVPSMEEALSALRYGQRGIGLLAQEEIGLHRFDDAEVLSWAAERFTADNATMILTGDPARLTQPLGHGARWPLPETQPLEPHQPIALETSSEGATLSFTAPRSDALAAGMVILEKRAEQLLRHERGISYGVASGSLQQLRSTYGFIGADSRAADSAAVLDGLIGEFRRLACEPPGDDELADDLASLRRSLLGRDPITRLAWAAIGELLGRVHVTAAEIIAAVSAVTPAAVTKAIADAEHTLHIACPAAVKPPSGFVPLPPGPAFNHPGTTFKARRLFRSERVVVGQEAISVVEAERATIRIADVEALLCWENGDRTLWDVEGNGLDIWCSEFTDDDRLRELIDDLIPRRLHTPAPGSPRDD